MEYKELKILLKTDYNISDKHIDCLMYYESLDEEILNNVEVVEIFKDLVILDFYKYFIHNFEKCKKYIYEKLDKKFIDNFQQNDFNENISKNKDAVLYRLFLYALGFFLSALF